MTGKSRQGPNQKNNDGVIFNVEGGIHAQHVIMGSQYNNPLPAINDAAGFISELRKLQAQILELKQHPEMDAADAMQVESAAARVQTAIAEAEQPRPMAERINTTLTKAQQTLTLLSGSVKAAMGLGATLAALGAMALKLFGG